MTENPTASGSVVDTVTHPLALEIRELLTRSGRETGQRILIDDEENIAQAARAGVRIERLFHSGADVPEDLRALVGRSVPVHEVARRTCKKLFEVERLSRIFAVATTPAPVPLADLARASGDLVILDDLRIAGNIGAIVRTSVALGAGALLLTGMAHADLFDRRLIRASRGLVFSLPVVATTAAELTTFCAQAGIAIVNTVPHGGTPIARLGESAGRVALVFGGEKHGGSDELARAAAFSVTIPTARGVDSLNVSAAAAIALYVRAPFNATGRDGAAS